MIIWRKGARLNKFRVKELSRRFFWNMSIKKTPGKHYKREKQKYKELHINTPCLSIPSNQ